MILRLPIEEDDEGYYIIDKPEIIIDIIRGIVSFMGEEDWDASGGSIWTYDEMRGILEENIINLSLIYGFMKENPDVYLEFYDSY